MARKKKYRNRVSINICIESGLLDKIDKEAKELGISRSKYIQEVLKADNKDLIALQYEITELKKKIPKNDTNKDKKIDYYKIIQNNLSDILRLYSCFKRITAEDFSAMVMRKFINKELVNNDTELKKLRSALAEEGFIGKI